MRSDAFRFHGDQLARPGMLDFAVNIWPTPRPPALQDALDAALAASQPYPDPGPAIAAIAGRHHRPRQEVLALNGACEAFWLLARTLRPRHAVCIHPCFTEPDAALQASGIGVDHVLRSNSDWGLQPSAVPATADLVMLGNPNNPTGTLDRSEDIAQLARPGRVLVVDESFLELTQRSDQSLAERRDIPGLVVIRSITKLWGLAGLRAGYCLAPPDLIEEMEGHRQPWSVNTVALAALQYCAGDRTTPPRVAAEVAAARADLMGQLNIFPGLRSWPAAANFVLLQAVGRGRETVSHLADAGIIVRPAHSFPGLDQDYFRVAVRTPEAHAILADGLRAILGHGHSAPTKPYGGRSSGQRPPAGKNLESVGWLRIRDGRLLVVRTKGNDAFYLPGGKPEPGEDPVTALVREVDEELGLQLRGESLQEAFTVEDAAHGLPGQRVRMRCFTGPATGQPQARAEIEALDWVSNADEARCAPAVQQVLRRLRATGQMP
ncbi:MAG: aminotransferase class I/II-fold pyridoxal phosphate-dependent enzyme [Geodermatophilaceae bacterium]